MLLHASSVRQMLESLLAGCSAAERQSWGAGVAFAIGSRVPLRNGSRRLPIACPLSYTS